MSVVLPDPTKLYNGIAHSVLQFDGSRPLTPERRAELRAAYCILLDRATIIRVHDSGWVAHLKFATPEDGALANAIEEEMFIRSSVHPSQIENALRAISAK